VLYAYPAGSGHGSTTGIRFPDERRATSKRDELPEHAVNVKEVDGSEGGRFERGAGRGQHSARQAMNRGHRVGSLEKF